jgi:hypothetical protein
MDIRPGTHERWIYMRARHVLSNACWVSVQTSVALRACACFKMHAIQAIWPFYLVLQIIKKNNHSRRWRVHPNDIFMVNSTHYIPVSEKTVTNSLITSVSLQPPSMNFCVIKNPVMRTNTNMKCGIALQGKLYELPVWQFGKQWGTDSYLHLTKEINMPIFLTVWEQ